MKSFDIRLLNQSPNRIMGEVSANGFYTLGYALVTNHMSYDDYYPTVDKNFAYSRVSKLVFNSKGSTHNSLNPMEHNVPAQSGLGNKNVVIILEESLGSKFVGVLRHHPMNLTPNLDALSKKGLFFDRFYATGNRTVRALEAVFTSFPPIPGASIVKRSKSQNIASLARVLKTKNYATVFIYGGRGVFDNMRSFMLDNGFDRFIEQKDYLNPTFTSVWGVADEEIFQKSLDTFDELQKEGKPFFSTILSVSNHKPYTFPAGRIDLSPNVHSRDHAVKYADWALGEFFKNAESHAFFKDTIFVVLGDHGARVYGADFIPIESYEIPLLIYAPHLISTPKIINTMGCSLDIAPTILGLLGFNYKSTFYGRDLLKVAPQDGYALLQHDRDVGLLKNDQMAVLGTKKTSRLFAYDNKLNNFTQIEKSDPMREAFVHDAVSFYQTAYDLYSRGEYKVDPL